MSDDLEKLRKRFTDDELILILWARGNPLPWIAETLGVDLAVVERVVKESKPE